MIGPSGTLPPKITGNLTPVYRLADQLDSALAIAEDLLQQSADCMPPTWPDANRAITDHYETIATFARTVRALELALTARVLQARHRAQEIGPKHPQFAPLIALLAAGTATLADAAAGRDGDLGDVTPEALGTGEEVRQFLVSRCLVDESTRSLGGITSLRIGEDFLIAARVQLGPLMDMIAQFLETLDMAFDLYVASPSAASSASPTHTPA